MQRREGIAIARSMAWRLNSPFDGLDSRRAATNQLLKSVRNIVIFSDISAGQYSDARGGDRKTGVRCRKIRLCEAVSGRRPKGIL